MVDISTLQIETTNRCNLNCPHCALYEDGESGTDYNDYITKIIIDNFFGMDIRLIHNINFTGGEPLLNIEGIIYTLEKIMKEKIKVLSIDIATNGTILSEKLINILNRFAEYVTDEVLNEVSIKDENTLEEKDKSKLKGLVKLRISRLYHDNDCEKAFDFYSKKTNSLVDVYIIDSENKMESRRVAWGLENRMLIAYSGRAKKLNAEFYCDSPHHKIVYKEWSKDKDVKCVRCPLKLMVNGDLGIACYCSIKDEHKDAIGNVNDGKSLSEMIMEWNYKIPLTCDEACNLEEVRMYYETNRLEDISRVLEKEISHKDLEEMLEKEEAKCFYIEKFRRLLHKKMPSFTSDEIEWISHFWFDLETEKVNNEISEEEYRQRSKELNNHMERLLYEHFFDDVKEVHEELPYLTHEECVEIKECERICKMYQGKVINLRLLPYANRGIELIRLNEYRSKNVKNFFD